MNQLGLSTQNSTPRAINASHTLPIPSWPRADVVPAHSTKRVTPLPSAKSRNWIIGTQGCATCGSIMYTALTGAAKAFGHVDESAQSNLTCLWGELEGGLRDARVKSMLWARRRGKMRVEVLPVPPVRRTAMATLR